MYRPKKKQLVRRLSVTSVLVLTGATGLGVALLNQGGAASSALTSAPSAPASTTKVATASSLSAATISTPAFHIVSTGHDDAGHESDN